jgi:hypothetical protein
MQTVAFVSDFHHGGTKTRETHGERQGLCGCAVHPAVLREFPRLPCFRGEAEAHPVGGGAGAARRQSASVMNTLFGSAR